MTRVRVTIVFLATLAIVVFVEDSTVALVLLVSLWALSLRPLSPFERGAFVIAPVFFLGMNYAVLVGGGFAFRNADLLLQPWWEPPIWGFWYLVIHRLAGRASAVVEAPAPGRAVLAFLATAAAFGSPLRDPTLMLAATAASTGVVLALFHARDDLVWGGVALGVGTAVELAGVLGGAWLYPRSRVAGVPLWYGTMWISVGVLGRRVLLPLAVRLPVAAARRPRRTAQLEAGR